MASPTNALLGFGEGSSAIPLGVLRHTGDFAGLTLLIMLEAVNERCLLEEHVLQSRLSAVVRCDGSCCGLLLGWRA